MVISGFVMALLLLLGQTTPVQPMDLELPELSGGRGSLASYRGKVVLLNVWSTTCPPCRVEIPWLVTLHRELRPRGFAVISVSIDDSPERLRPFVEKIGINYPVLLGLGAGDRIDAALGGVWALPTTYILDRDGRIARKHVGLTSETQLRQWIDEVIRARR
jgi:peroxiredoxin